MAVPPVSEPDILSLLENGFNEETARSLYAQGEAVVIFALMQLAALALKSSESNDPHTHCTKTNTDFSRANPSRTMRPLGLEPRTYGLKVRVNYTAEKHKNALFPSILGQKEALSSTIKRCHSHACFTRFCGYSRKITGRKRVVRNTIDPIYFGFNLLKSAIACGKP